MKSAKSQSRWAPMKYQMGLDRTVKAPISGLKPSKRTTESINIVTDVIAGGLLGTTAFMLVSPKCMMPGNPAAGDHPEAALLTGLLLSGTWWAFTGENYALISGMGTTLGLYAICKIFM